MEKNNMGAKRKKILTIAGVLCALIIVAAIAIALLFDINSYKPRIEAAASKAANMDIRINGNMGLSFFPVGVSVNDIHIAGKTGEIASLKKLKIGLEVIPLLKNELKVTGCELVEPTITITKDTEGKFNFGNSKKKPAEKGALAALGFKRIMLSQGTLDYIDKKTGDKTELRGINLVIDNLSAGGASRPIPKNISFTGNMECKEARIKNLKIDNFRSSVKAENGVFTFMPVTMDIFGAIGEGNATIDNSNAGAEYKINLKATRLDFAKFEESLSAKKAIGGKGDLYVSLTMNERQSRDLISSMNGTFSVKGDNLIIYTMNLDNFLSSYEKSQEFNLVDLGAFFIAGPLSTVALKGYHYADIYRQAQGGQSAITHFISFWNIKDGVAEAADCALATQHNRIALKGRVNLVSQRYENVIVALLDNKGCAKLQQKITGSFDKPQINPISAVESLAGPIIDLYKKAKGIVVGEKCEAFYNGSIKQP